MSFENLSAGKGMRAAFLFLLFFSTFSAVSAETVVINSKDWKDVYYGILYAHYHNYQVFFANSPNPAGLFNILPKDKIILIESSQPFVPNLEAQLRIKGYTLAKKIKVSSPYKELMPSGMKKFYVVEEDFPWLCLPAGALARSENAWVLIVNENNARDIAGILSKASQVIGIGRFKRSVENVLSPYFSRRVEAESKFDIAVELAKEFVKKKKVSQILITEGKYLEPELLKGHAPVLLVGSNLLPEEVVNFIKENDIKTVVAIGAQLTYVGEKIREKTNKKTSVFIKFGMSTPGISPRIYALTFFPLPKPELKLSILRVVYDPEKKKLMVQFSNNGNTGIFEFTTFRVLRNGEEVASGGDSQAAFIGAGEKIWKSYEIALSELTGNFTVEFYTAYGEDPKNLDTYLTEGGRKFAPPLVMPLEMANIRDRSKVEVLEIKYYRDAKKFGVKIKNVGDVKAVVVVKLLNVKIRGMETSLSSEPRVINPGELKEIFIPAELDEEDLKEIANIKVEVDYGEREEVIVNSAVVSLPVKVVSGSTVFYTGLGVAIVAIAVALLKFRRRYSGYAYKPARYRYKPRK